MQHNNSRINALKISTRHLKYSSCTWINCNNFTSSFDCSDIEVAGFVQQRMLGYFTIFNGFWQFFVEIVVEKLMT